MSDVPGALEAETVTTIWADGTVEKPVPCLDLYTRLCKEETGLPVPDEIVEKCRRQKRVIREQTFLLADKLEKEGIAAYRDSQYFFWQFFVHSGTLEELPLFRRIMFLPSVAASVRAPILKAAESFVERHPFCRFWTFTTGEPVPVELVGDRLDILHDRLSDLNAEPFMKEAGVEIVLRSSELGTTEFDGNGARVAQRKWGRIRRGPDGKPLYHVHAHTIVHLRDGFVEDWSGLLSKVWAFWGHIWDEGGAIRNAREAVKYVTKPSEVLTLSGPELVALHKALTRRKLVQTMGTLAAEIAARRDGPVPLKLVRRPSPNGNGRVFREVPDWNRTGPAPKREKKEGEAKRDTFRVIAKNLPTIGGSTVKEPSVTMMSSYRLTSALAASHPLVKRIVSDTADEFRAGLLIRVHTCTPTVPQIPPERPKRPRGKPRVARMGAGRAGY